MKTPWPSPQARAPLARFTDAPPREPARPTIAPAASLGGDDKEPQEPKEPRRSRRVRAQRPTPTAPPRLPTIGRRGSRLMQSIALIVGGVGIGVAFAYAFSEDLPAAPALAETTAGGKQASVSAPAAALQQPAAEFEAHVLRFAWASTCDVAITGVTRGGINDIRQAIQTAHDQATLFEAGIVPPDVAAVLDDAYALIVTGPASGRTDGAAEQRRGLGARIDDACRTWSSDIDAAATPGVADSVR